MPRLSNKLHEDFARAVAEGDSPTGAYRRLSPSAKNPNTLGSRLWNRPDVRRRVAEISSEAMEQSHLTIVQKRRILEQQILGKAPTKIVVKPGGTELVYDTLGAIMLDSRMAGHLDGDTSEQPQKLVLTFSTPHRDADPTLVDVEFPQLPLGCPDKERRPQDEV